MLSVMANQTSNGTSSEQTTNDEFKNILMTCLYTVSFLFAFVGNSLGMYIVWRRCGIKAATHLLIANLACSNLLISVIVMPMSVVFLYVTHRWSAELAGTVTCKLAQYLCVFPIATSILTILIVSVDRFFAVFHPLKGQVFRKPSVMTATIWICSAILMSPALVFFRVDRSADGEWYCEIAFEGDLKSKETFAKVYFIFLFAVLYLLPLFVITVLYTLVSCKLYHRKIPGDQRTRSRSAAVENAKRKVIKVLGVIVATFAVCWFPAHVVHYLAVFHKNVVFTIPSYVSSLLLWISHTNSAIDPFLYILLSQNFRKEFRKVLTQCGYYQKKRRWGKRMSRVTRHFSRHRSHRGKNGASSFWSFRQGATFKGIFDEVNAKSDAHNLNMLNRSPQEQQKSPQEQQETHRNFNNVDHKQQS